MRTTLLFFSLLALLLGPLTAFGQSSVNFFEGTVQLEGQSLKVQIAATEHARERGLMFRETLQPYDGMLFVFEKPQPVAFWMKNTQIPLDIGYFDKDGTLREIYPLEPHNLTPVSSQRSDILYALELPRGDFVKRGLKLGSKLVINSPESGVPLPKL